MPFYAQDFGSDMPQDFESDIIKFHADPRQNWSMDVGDLLPFGIVRVTEISLLIFDPRYERPRLYGSGGDMVKIVFNGRTGQFFVLLYADKSAHYDAVRPRNAQKTVSDNVTVKAVEAHMPMADDEMKDEIESHMPMADDEIEDSDEFYSSCVFPHISCCKLRCYESTSVEMIM
jgi:hypothetical protein